MAAPNHFAPAATKESATSKPFLGILPRAIMIYPSDKALETMDNFENSDSPAHLKLEDFRPDTPFHLTPSKAVSDPDLIDGVTIRPLIRRPDNRGALIELLTTRDQVIEPIVHVYLVEAKAGSVRAWVYHRYQFDRLAYTQGSFQVVLYDIRPESPTYNKLNVLTFGEENPAMLRIPPFVVHGVKNIGAADSTFVNLPTNIYDPQNPDKSRIGQNDPRIPFSFDD